jgi:hypothetical protein
MGYFISPATKLERAMRALLILEGKTTWDDAFISNDSRARTLPNRTFVVRSFSPTRGWRPEGVCQMEIQHHFAAVDQPNQTPNSQQVSMENYVGDTLDTLNLGGQAEATNMSALADAITNAGRWLAIPDPNGTPGDAADLIVKANLDMANFRCDWVKLSTPHITRGNDTATTNWVEIIHLSAFVSHSNAALPN